MLVIKDQDVVSSCIRRWGANDERTAYFKDNYDEWLSQIPDDIKETVLYLLGKFDYYSQESVMGLLNELGTHLDGRADFNRDTAVFTYIPSKKGIENSSIDLLLEYKRMHKIAKFKTIISIETYLRTHEEQVSAIESVVIVDDFCGSGKSMKDFIENNSWLKGKTLYYLVTYAMDNSLDSLQIAAKAHEVKLNVLYINHAKRAFDDTALSENQCEARASIMRFSDAVGIPRYLYRGRDNTESLVAFYYDTPNNTLGIFCYDTDRYFSLFPREREDERPVKRPAPSKMRADKQKRTIQNYNASARGSYNGFR